MAENEEDAPASQADQRNRYQTTRKPRSPPKDTTKPKCRSRIDQLAIPSRRLILALYQDHAEHLSRDKVEKIKVLLQELYAMTPEETEKYFDHLRKKAKEIGRRKDIKYMLKKLVRKRKKAKQIHEAYQFIMALLVRGMEYAFQTPIPPLVSVRLRNMSNIILEQICDLRNVNIPDRDQPDQVGAFLIKVADWMAIAVEHLYYMVQLKKNRELEQIEIEAKEREKETVKHKTKILEEVPSEAEAEEGIISEPVMLYDME